MKERPRPHGMADVIDDRIDAEIAVNRAWKILSDCELIIAQRIMLGQRLPKIAEKMGISKQAVYAHISRMRKKFH
jgi:DNA-binding CsgD family transcriptional regulator